MSIEELIAKISASEQHKYLYHFTDESNFSSITQRGLVSKETMKREDWWPHATGGNALSQSLDAHRGIDKFISLCMTRNHSMQYLAQRDGRLPNSRYLAISPDVLRIEGVKISFGIANSNDVEILALEQGIEKLDVEVLYSRTNWSDPSVQQRLGSAEKYEILIPNLVPSDLIVGVF